MEILNQVKPSISSLTGKVALSEGEKKEEDGEEVKRTGR